MSSDSSDDEHLSKLREAADSEFINDSMFKETGSKKSPPPKLQSLRPSREQEDQQFNLFKVSPQFREYVAKHLTSLLDKSLEQRLTDNHSVCVKPKRRKKSGIKLLKASQFVISKQKETLPAKLPLKINQEVDDLKKIEEVVVSPDDILSKKEVKHWSNRSKAPIYRYVSTINGLVEK